MMSYFVQCQKTTNVKLISVICIFLLFVLSLNTLDDSPRCNSPVVSAVDVSSRAESMDLDYLLNPNLEEEQKEEEQHDELKEETMRLDEKRRRLEDEDRQKSADLKNQDKANACHNKGNEAAAAAAAAMLDLSGEGKRKAEDMALSAFSASKVLIFQVKYTNNMYLHQLLFAESLQPAKNYYSGRYNVESVSHYDAPDHVTAEEIHNNLEKILAGFRKAGHYFHNQTFEQMYASQIGGTK